MLLGSESSPRRVAKSAALPYGPTPVAERAPAAPSHGLAGQIGTQPLVRAELLTASKDPPPRGDVAI